MSPTIRHNYKYFHSIVQRAKDRRPKFHFCRFPFDVRPRNVKLNLSNFMDGGGWDNFQQKILAQQEPPKKTCKGSHVKANSSKCFLLPKIQVLFLILKNIITQPIAHQKK